MSIVLEHRFHAVTGLDPVADAFSGTVYSDIVNCSAVKAIHFLVHHGVGATGTRTYTVQACDDVSASNTSAVPFYYAECLASGTSDVMNAAPALKTAAGVTTTAGSGQVHTISVHADQLAASGYKFCRLKSVEVVDSPVLGGITILLESQTPRKLHPTAIA